MKFFITISFAFISSAFFAQNQSIDFEAVSPVSFYENKGQIMDQYGHPRTDIHYMYVSPSMKVHLRDNAISYELIKFVPASISRTAETTPVQEPPLLQSTKTEIHRIDVEFVGARKFPELTPAGKSASYDNYYLNNSAGVTGVYHYNSVTYKHIYPNIDLVLYQAMVNSVQTFKYDFILHPGANPNHIKIRYHGASKVSIEKGNLHIHTSQGVIEEAIPESYYLDSGLNKQPAKTTFRLANNELTYIIAAYDQTRKLVIDPVVARKWATFYVGSSNEYGRSIKTDNAANCYLGGFTYGNSSSLATVGAYQTSAAGGFDSFIAKFNNAGQRIWGTYYGASTNINADDDQLKSLCLDYQGNIITGGTTSSLTGMTTIGAHQTGHGGGAKDIYLAKFTPSGFLSWSTYYGGNQDEDCTEITTDYAGNIILCGHTGSNCSDTIASPGSFQPVYGGNTVDGFIAKFSPAGIRLWGTYFGSTSKDWLYACCCDVSGNIYCAGSTEATSGLTTTQVYQPAYSGSDVIVTKFSPSGNRVWASYYGNLAGKKATAIAIDSQHKLIIAGKGSYYSGFYSPGAYQTSSIYDPLFIAKMDTAFTTRFWGTLYGGMHSFSNNNETIDDIKTDAYDNIIITGSTVGNANIMNSLASSGSYRTNGVSYEGFISKFDSAGFRVWGTLYGGSGHDYLSESAVDSIGNVYSYGYTSSSDMTGTPGTYMPSCTVCTGTSWHSILAKFDQLTINVGSITGPVCPGTQVSVPFSATGDFAPTNTFQIELSGPTGSFATPTVIGTISGVTSGTITATIPFPIPGGTGYKIRGRSVDRAVSDVANGTNFTIHNVPQASIYIFTDICQNAHIIPMAQVSPGGQPAGGVFSGPGVDNQGNFDASLLNLGQSTICYSYTDAQSCTTQTVCQSFTIHAPPVVTFPAINPNTICLTSGPITLPQASPPGGLYVGPGTTGNSFDPQQAGVGTHSIAYIYFNINGCYDTAYQSINVVQSSAIPTITLMGNTFVSSPALSYQWYLNNTLIAGATGQNYIPGANGNYTVLVLDPSGCYAQSLPFTLNSVGIPGITPPADILLYPVPVSGILTVTGIAGKNIRQLQLFNACGASINIESPAIKFSANDGFSLNLSDFAPGVYFLDITTNEGKSRHKIVCMK